MALQINKKPSSIGKKLTSSAILVLYALIMLEGILMAAPFALYLYSYYFPFLWFIAMGRALKACCFAGLIKTFFETISGIIKETFTF